MNYKALFPTYRNRYLFIRGSLERLSKEGKLDHILNLGTGEGDYDRMIAAHCDKLTAVDINEDDIDYARSINQDVLNVTYGVDNALDLSFPDNSFDAIVSVEVLEHVGRPDIMIREVQRVLKPGGFFMGTFPQVDFPITYDPINRILSWFSDKHIPHGAYAFGHDYLVDQADFDKWAEENQLLIVKERNLSGYLVALLEIYWTGIIQRIFKVNASNTPEAKERKITLRPTPKEPALTRVTDFIVWFDHLLFKRARKAVGIGFILQKPTDRQERSGV